MIDHRRKEEEEWLEELMKEAALFIKYAIQQAGRIPPMLFIHGQDGVAKFSADELKDECSKDRFADLARLACVAVNADATVFVSEAWMKTAKRDEKMDMSRAPSSYPDREEVAIMLGQTRTACQQRLLPMLRSNDGKFVGFGSEHKTNPDRMEGRFANFIPWNYPPAKERAAAQAALEKLGVEIGKKDQCKGQREERGQGRSPGMQP